MGSGTTRLLTPERDVPNGGIHREKSGADLLIWQPRRRGRGKANRGPAGRHRFRCDRVLSLD